MPKLKPKTRLTPGKAAAEAFKRTFVYPGVRHPTRGYTLVHDRGHPNASIFRSPINFADMQLSKGGGAKGDGTYMQRVASDGKRIIAPHMATKSRLQDLKGQKVSISTLIDHRALHPFDAHFGLADALSRARFDASVVAASPKAGGNKRYMVLSQGHYLDLLEGTATRAESVTSRFNIKPIEGLPLRKLSDHQQPIDYAALPRRRVPEQASERRPQMSEIETLRARKAAMVERAERTGILPGGEQLERINSRIRQLEGDGL